MKGASGVSQVPRGIKRESGHTARDAKKCDENVRKREKREEKREAQSQSQKFKK